MTTRLIDKNWGGELAKLAERAQSLRIICPFIKTGGLEYLRIEGFENIKVITRFNEHDFYNGVSDIAALRQLLEADAEIRGVKELHSKVYLFSESHAVITSANLTQSAMTSNHECGVVSTDGQIITECCEYFNDLWKKAGDNLAPEDLENSYEAVNCAKTEAGDPRKPANLKDWGVKISGISAPSVQAPAVSERAEAPQAFVRYYGSGSAENYDRASLSSGVIDELKDSGCHWAVCSSKRRRQMKDGAVVFIGRFTKKPNDITIFGRAVGFRHDDNRDVASAEEIDEISWKEEWPYYNRVHSVQFVKGTLKNGVSLNEMGLRCKHKSSWPTLENYKNGHRDERRIDPKHMRRSGSLQLAPVGLAWLEKRLEAAFQKHGKLTEEDLRRDYDLDWPDLKKTKF